MPEDRQGTTLATSTGPPGRSEPSFYGCWLDMAESELGVLGSPRVRKVLGSSSKKAGPPVRHLKIGSVIVREHQGKVHEVLESAIIAVSQGFTDANKDRWP